MQVFSLAWLICKRRNGITFQGTALTFHHWKHVFVNEVNLHLYRVPTTFKYSLVQSQILPDVNYFLFFLVVLPPLLVVQVVFLFLCSFFMQ
jgi:hypothetical protein